MAHYILFKDNVFASGEVDYPHSKALKSDPSVVAVFDDYKTERFFGGRVVVRIVDISHGIFHLSVDGIQIQLVRAGDDNPLILDPGFLLSQVTAYLTQMQNLGVDTFLANYKQSVQEFKAEVQEMTSKLEQELAVNADDAKGHQLNSLRCFLSELMCILFALTVNMNAGLDNYVYVDAIESIQHLLN